MPPSTYSVPSILLTNACHVTNKITELSGIAAVNNPSLVIITESWLNSNISDAAIEISEKFNAYRRDRPTPGGGVLAYVHHQMPTTRLTNLEVEDKEVLWLLLKPPRTPRPYSAIIVISVYYPPGQTMEDERAMLEYITNGLDEILKDHPSAGIIIAGDFNKMKLNLVCRRFNLCKVVRAPTRGRNILDQILTNMSEFYNDIQHLPPIGRSDHQCLLLTPKLKEKVKAISRKVRLTKCSNLIDLSVHLNRQSWEMVYDADEIDDKVSKFTSMITRILDKTLPKRTVRFHPSDKPWMTPRIKQEIKARQKAFTSGNRSRYQLLCDKVSSLISSAKKTYYQSKAEDTRVTSPAKWYKIIYELVAANDCNFQSSAAPTDDLAERLQQSFTKPWQSTTPNEKPKLEEIEHLLKDTKPLLPSIGQIKAILKHLNPKKASGSDDIPAWLLKRYSEELAPIIHNIICSSISQSKYPTLYKHALVTPVPKVYPRMILTMISGKSLYYRKWQKSWKPYNLN
ncbi:uncharacterized protein LOC114532151 [Dendronephthya gigantea]|uniref:uncharacterized protein LOC114532151 n=1 Tax=Dendronephthya gigantea TaxID=151771 RepID=UPI00106B539A|nr:uncharacterized protein LOC114532151 [Dendronephthya gigantea]